MPADEKDPALSAFPDEEQNRKANMLQLSSIMLLLGATMGLIIIIFSNEFNLIMVFCFMLVGALTSVILLRFGHILFASWILLLCLLTSSVFILYIADGIHDMIILLFPISIMIASMLLDRRSLIAYSLIVFLSIHTFIICELTGTINNRMSHFTSFLDLISVGILMTVSIALSYKMSDSITRNFLKVHHINNSLQSQIVDRQIIEIEIKTKVKELERYKKATIDRELKMIELKDRLKSLEQRS